MSVRNGNIRLWIQKQCNIKMASLLYGNINWDVSEENYLFFPEVKLPNVLCCMVAYTGVAGGAGGTPAVIGRKAGYTLDRSPVYRRADIHNHT
ncbi:hypothetical protein AOLI_G00175200 [Acnodon oligacanthus]